ncbi:MAG: DNA polymerase [bacterium]|nr:DNA polymerase [bacterium]
MSNTARKRLVILDTHAILHRAYHALPELSSSKGEPTGALYGLISILVRAIIDLAPDYIVAAYDLPGPTHRHLAFEKYKAQRATTDDVLVAQIIRSRDVLDAFGIPRYEASGFEADDVIGTIVAETKGEKNLEVIIASGDLDMMQLLDGMRVRVFRMRKGLADLILYDQKLFVEEFGFASELLPDYKGLRGDPSDNIPGVKGIGEKTASILIAQFGTIENLYKILKKNPEKVLAAGVTAGMVKKLEEGEEEAEFSKTLAEIRRDAPVDFVLPKKEWRAGVDAQKTLNMLAEFDFRSLVPRVKTILAGNSFGKVLGGPRSAGQEGAELAPDFPSRISSSPDVSPQNSFLPAPDSEEFQKAALAVSVIDSSIAEPEIEDIYRVGESNDFAEAYRNLLAEIQARGLSDVYEKIEVPLSPVLRRMEARGVLVDINVLKKLSKEYTEELNNLAKRIYAMADEEFNIASPKQLGQVLFDRLGLVAKKKTARGQRSTREAELVKLKGAHPIIDAVLAHRELSKLLSTYINAIPTLLDKQSRLHTRYVQIGAATGRMASKDPNLQNIPIKSELGRVIRHAFVATKGMQLVSFDYSQIELRVSALLSGDEALSDIFRNGRDVHTEVAVRVFGVRADQVSWEQRRRAKVINFGILYGMGVSALRESLGATRAEAQEFYNQYFETFPRLARYLAEVKQDAARLGYTRTFFGRRRYVEGIVSTIPFVRAASERAAMNAPIQGTAADILKLAMVEIAQWIEKERLQKDIQLLLQVHDELVFEISDIHVREHAPHIKKIMEGVILEKDRKGIPFTADGKVGGNWGDMKAI